MITKLTIKRKPKQDKKYYVEFEGKREDTSGLGGTWESSGSLYVLHRCQGYWIAIGFNMEPIFLFKTMEEVANHLEETFSCEVILPTV